MSRSPSPDANKSSTSQDEPYRREPDERNFKELTSNSNSDSMEERGSEEGGAESSLWNVFNEKLVTEIFSSVVDDDTAQMTSK